MIIDDAVPHGAPYKRSNAAAAPRQRGTAATQPSDALTQGAALRHLTSSVARGGRLIPNPAPPGLLGLGLTPVPSSRGCARCYFPRMKTPGGSELSSGDGRKRHVALLHSRRENGRLQWALHMRRDNVRQIDND